MMRPFTPWGGVDLPSKGEVTPCLGFWFLNPRACRVCLHCIIYHVISYACLTLCLRNHIFYPQIFSCCLEKIFYKYFYGDNRESTLLLICLSNSEPLSLRTGLILPHMLGLDIISFPHNMFLLFFCFFFFLLIAFKISYVLLLDISIHCALIEYAYIWLRVYTWYLLSFHVAS
jgi:hypothetical protein